MIDDATTGKKNNNGWWNFGDRLTIGTPDDEGTTLTMSGNLNGYYYMYPNGSAPSSDTGSYIYDKIGLEFDVVNRGTTISNNGVIFYDGTNQQIIGFQWMNASDGDHIEVTYNREVFNVKVNGVTKITYNKVLGTFRCALIVSWMDTIKYKNFKCYLI